MELILKEKIVVKPSTLKLFIQINPNWIIMVLSIQDSCRY